MKQFFSLSRSFTELTFAFLALSNNSPRCKRSFACDPSACKKISWTLLLSSFFITGTFLSKDCIGRWVDPCYLLVGLPCISSSLVFPFYLLSLFWSGFDNSGHDLNPQWACASLTVVSSLDANMGEGEWRDTDWFSGIFPLTWVSTVTPVRRPWVSKSSSSWEKIL